MKRTGIILGIVILAAFFSQDIQASATAQLPEVKSAELEREGSKFAASVTLDLSDVKVKGNSAVVFQPMIVNGTDTLVMPGVGVYGKTRKHQLQRRNEFPITGPDELTLNNGKHSDPVTLSGIYPYEPWMDGSEMILRRMDYGCAGCGDVETIENDLAQYHEIKYEPDFMFAAAVAETVKTRELSGRAYVDFPVNQTVIYPDYRRNTIELAKIIATIDSVKNDKDITVTSLSIKGFASPEGPYDNNIRLAKGRTEALKNYVQQLYKFPEGFIKTSYEPEDWEGLREWVVNSNIDNKEGIISIIDSDLAPDPKNTKIQTTYPVQYKFLLDNVYPGLRHSDYRIEYEIRQFTDVAEIAEVMKTAPQKLSLNEMYVLAGSLEPGSDAYNEVFETAVRMYPNDETANINAANSEMMRGNLETAERYLQKAGNSVEANHAREILEKLKALRENK
ncbi:MAG: DUF3868 domain-containing protein [Muribaculaceae bacterium]|nr:DUF3868 domain-containing protein [Muribaculaceae bacterium]